MVALVTVKWFEELPVLGNDVGTDTRIVAVLLDSWSAGSKNKSMGREEWFIDGGGFGWLGGSS